MSEIRLRFLQGLFLLGWAGLIGVLAYRQIFRYSYYARLSQSNILRAIPLPAPRALIEDRNGEILAGYAVGVVFVRTDPGVSTPFPSFASSQVQYLPQSRVLPFEEALPHIHEIFRYPGVFPLLFPLRTYPQGRGVAHLVGYVAEAQEESAWGRFVGRMGVERAFETYLRGEDGLRFLQVDARGELRGWDFLPPHLPKMSPPLRLSVDLRLQKTADSLFHGYRGAAVMLNVKTGEVLLLYSAPTFDPDSLLGPARSAYWKTLLTSPDRPLLNRALQGLYAPGSTLKPLFLLLALARNAVHPEEKLAFCDGTYTLGNRTWKCWNPGGHGRLAAVDAIAQSCDVYFYALGNRLGLGGTLEILKTMEKTLHRAPLLLPEARRGKVPTLESYRTRYGAAPPQGLALNLAIGQGEILMTPYEMAVMAGLLATRGNLPAPHLLRNTLPPETLRLEAPEWAWAVVQTGMWKVVNDPSGTAFASRLPWLVYAGKTGTVQNPHGDEHSMFIGYAPYSDPEVAFTVVVENAGSGSQKAAPFARTLLEVFFREETYQTGPDGVSRPAETGSTDESHKPSSLPG